jgi:acid phosphatase (class A)
MKSHLRRFPLCFVLVLLSLTILAQPLRADDKMDQPTKPAEKSELHYVRAGKPDANTLLAPPPLLNSPEQDADLDTVRAVSRAASSNETAAALSEAKFSVYNFTAVIGSFFQSNKLPVTTAFFQRVQMDAETVTDNSKNFFKRPRPYTIDHTLASGKLEKSFSYPSGHSTESMVLALVLAEVFPDKHDAILFHAREMGWHRVEIARHYPTDIYAGRVLAQAIVREMDKNREFQKDLAAAKKEVAAALQASNQRPAPLAAAK